MKSHINMVDQQIMSLDQYYDSVESSSLKKQWEDGSWKTAEMKFGKYRGDTLEKVASDKKYCYWLRDNIKHYPGALSYMLCCMYKQVPVINLDIDKYS